MNKFECPFIKKWSRNMTTQLSSHDEIKKRLEAEFSYIIFESSKSEAIEFEFTRIIDLLRHYKGHVLKHDAFFENSSKKFLLVAKLYELLSEDLIMKVFRQIPDGCSVYFYFSVQKEKSFVSEEL